MIGRLATRSMASACSAFSRSVGSEYGGVATSSASAPACDRGLRVFDRFLGAQRAGAGDKRDAAPDPLIDEFHQRQTLFHGLRVVLAGGAGGNQAVHAGVDQKIDDFGQPIVIDRKVVVIRGDHGRVNAFKFHLGFLFQALAVCSSNASGSGLTK